MKSWKPANWAALMPNGIGQTKPNHYLDMAAPEMRELGRLPYPTAPESAPFGTKIADDFS